MHSDPVSTVRVPNNGGLRGERDFKFLTMISQKAKEANKFRFPDLTQPDYIIKKIMHPKQSLFGIKKKIKNLFGDVYKAITFSFF